jgi:hypothetical protein
MVGQVPGTSQMLNGFGDTTRTGALGASAWWYWGFSEGVSALA